MAVIDQEVNDKYAIYNGDCCEVMATMPDNSIHLSVYSPPFGGLYHYSSNAADLSNCTDYKDFFDHYEFVVSELARLTMPGRISCVHCADVPSGNTGKGDYLIDFPGDIIRLHERMGWKRIASHIIWKEPLWVRNRTMVKALSHRTTVGDSANAGVASNDYLLVFRRDGKNEIPIEHPTGFDKYAGECPMPADVMRFKNHNGDQKQNRFSHWIWRRYASSIWDDINMGRVLPFRDCKENDDEKHVHPLQLDVIERAVVLRSNPGENVLTPFMGVGSEVAVPVELGRRGIGIELKPSYYRQAQANIKAALETGPQEQPDMIGEIQ